MHLLPAAKKNYLKIYHLTASISDCAFCQIMLDCWSLLTYGDLDSLFRWSTASTNLQHCAAYLHTATPKQRDRHPYGCMLQNRTEQNSPSSSRDSERAGRRWSLRPKHRQSRRTCRWADRLCDTSCHSAHPVVRATVYRLRSRGRHSAATLVFDDLTSCSSNCCRHELTTSFRHLLTLDNFYRHARCLAVSAMAMLAPVHATRRAPRRLQCAAARSQCSCLQLHLQSRSLVKVKNCLWQVIRAKLMRRATALAVSIFASCLDLSLFIFTRAAIFSEHCGDGLK